MGIFDWFKREDQLPETRKYPPIKCPQCGLLNPDGATRCDCGYSFPQLQLEEDKPQPTLAEILRSVPVVKNMKQQDGDIVKIQSSYDINIFYEVNPRAITCTCPDFNETHADYPKDDPRRLCKHLIRVFHEKDNLPDDLKFFKEGIEFFAGRKSGFPPSTYRKNTSINGEKIEIFFDEYDDTRHSLWISIYWKGKKYGHDLIYGSWGYSNIPEPENVLQIIAWIKTQIDGYNRELLCEGSIKTISRRKGKKKCNIKGVVEGITILAQIEFSKNIATMTLGKLDRIEVNLNTKEIRIPSYLKYMGNAIIYWIMEECKNISVM